MVSEKFDLARQLRVVRSESSFRDARVRGGLYVDKTEQVYNCIRDDKYLFLARPRRFGKSFLCSTLEEIFAGNRELFKGLWMDSSECDWDWEQHPVIKLDMTDFARENATGNFLNKKLCQELWRIAQEVYDISMPELEDDAPLALKAVILALVKKFKKSVVVIIDEYDKPLLDVIDNKDAFNDILSLLKSFYTQLKARAAELRLVFVTGVFKFSQAGMFSGANNFTDLTFDPKAATLVGYTQQELEHYFSAGIEALAEKAREDCVSMKERLKERYNGYCFAYDDVTGRLSESVYNSFGINHVFAATGLPKKWFLSGSPSILFKKLHAEDCKTLLEQELTIDLETLTTPSVPEEFNPLPLLYYGGYLTIKSFNPEDEILSFMWPNTEVSSAFTKQLLKERVGGEFNTVVRTAMQQICKDLKVQKFDQLQELFNQVLACIGYKATLSREDQYQLFFVMLLSAGGLKVRVEEITQDGRIDIVIEMRKLIYILELKIDESPQRAIQQIKNKDYARKYRAAGITIWAMGINLAGKSKDENKPKNTVNALVVEKLTP